MERYELKTNEVIWVKTANKTGIKYSWGGLVMFNRWESLGGELVHHVQDRDRILEH